MQHFNRNSLVFTAHKLIKFEETAALSDLQEILSTHGRRRFGLDRSSCGNSAFLLFQCRLQISTRIICCSKYGQYPCPFVQKVKNSCFLGQKSFNIYIPLPLLYATRLARHTIERQKIMENSARGLTSLTSQSQR